MSRNFRLRRKVPVEDDKNYFEYKERLETELRDRESRAGHLTEKLLQSLLVSEQEMAVTDLQEMRPSCDRESERMAGRNLRDIERLGQLELRECKVEVQGATSDNWERQMVIRSVPHTDFPHISLEQVLVTEDTKRDLPTIKSLQARLEGMEVERSLQRAINYCEEQLEPQLLTLLVRDFLPLNQEKQEILEQADKAHCTHLRSDNGYDVLEFINSRGNLLASIDLKVKLNLSLLMFVPEWRCQLTEEGTKACESFNIPSELAANGFIDSWNWKQAVDNLTKVARLDEQDTPSKEFDASKVNTDTPICGAKRNLTKRKL